MNTQTWIYSWVDRNGTIHLTTSLTEANEALHSPDHPKVYGARLRPFQEPPVLPESPYLPEDKKDTP